MTFGSTFGRTFSPTFQPKSQAAVAGDTWWDLNGTIASCVAAWQGKGAASYAASKTNLANPGTYDATDGAAYPTWDTSTGWSFNGSSQYLKTNYVPSAGANLSVFARANQLANGTHAINTIVGMHAASSPYNGVWLRLYAKAGTYSRYGNDGVSSIISTQTTGDHVIGVAGREGFLDGTSEATFSDITQAFPAYDLYIGAIHYSSTIQFFYGSIYAVSIYEGVLTTAQISSLTTAMAAL
jgi:hypothetical protein